MIGKKEFLQLSPVEAVRTAVESLFNCGHAIPAQIAWANGWVSGQIGPEESYAAAEKWAVAPFDSAQTAGCGRVAYAAAHLGRGEQESARWAAYYAVEQMGEMEDREAVVCLAIEIGRIPESARECALQLVEGKEMSVEELCLAL